MSVLLEEWSVTFRKDIGLQLGTLLNVTLLRRLFLRFAITLLVPDCETHQADQSFWLENNRLHKNLCVFIIISVLLYLLHFLSLHKSLIYSTFIYVLYDECSEDVTGA